MTCRLDNALNYVNYYQRGVSIFEEKVRNICFLIVQRNNKISWYKLSYIHCLEEVWTSGSISGLSLIGHLFLAAVSCQIKNAPFPPLLNFLLRNFPSMLFPYMMSRFPYHYKIMITILPRWYTSSIPLAHTLQRE